MEENTSTGTASFGAPDILALNEIIAQKSAFVDAIKNEMSKVIIGQPQMTNRLLVALLSNGHILLEGVPGLAKTLAITTLAQTVDAEFNRIQFTPDLLPADLVGTNIYNAKTGEFYTRKGPVFANFILADEINRAPAKVQSALLEAMQEKQVTIGDETHKLPAPFLVMATQNPVEQEGTYPLPEAQVDRFMMKVVLDYPKVEEEKLILRLNVSPAGFPKPATVANIDQILEAKKLVKQIYLDEKLEQYIVDLIYATRTPEAYRLPELTHLIGTGCSPRATISLAMAAKAIAFINHRGYVIPEDIREALHDVLRHRISLTYEAEAENITSDNIIDKIVNTVEVP